MSDGNTEWFVSYQVSPVELDLLLAHGWRHFGINFFRYKTSVIHQDIFHVIPLRINLAHFQISKSQKKILSKNQDTKIVIRPAEIDDEKESLFYQHIDRFQDNQPTSIYDFLSDSPHDTPCETYELCVYLKGKLIACSFFDQGRNSISSIYAMFDLTESKRSLGIYTMLLEIEYAIRTGKSYFYSGYAYTEPSVYDYKKRFDSLEYLQWSMGWFPFKRD